MTRIIIGAVIIAAVPGLEMILDRRRAARETPEQRIRRFNAEGWPPEDGIWFI